MFSVITNMIFAYSQYWELLRAGGSKPTSVNERTEFNNLQLINTERGNEYNEQYCSNITARGLRTSDEEEGRRRRRQANMIRTYFKVR